MYENENENSSGNNKNSSSKCNNMMIPASPQHASQSDETSSEYETNSSDVDNNINNNNNNKNGNNISTTAQHPHSTSHLLSAVNPFTSASAATLLHAPSWSGDKQPSGSSGTGNLSSDEKNTQRRRSIFEYLNEEDEEVNELLKSIGRGGASLRQVLSADNMRSTSSSPKPNKQQLIPLLQVSFVTDEQISNDGGKYILNLNLAYWQYLFV